MSCTPPLRSNAQIGPVTLTKGNDPTNTFPIRREFITGILRRFRRVRGLIRTTVGYENDAFQLSQSSNSVPTPDHSPLIANAEPREVYDFPTNPQKRAAFLADLRRWLRDEVLETTSEIDIRNGDVWWGEFIKNGYVQGWQTSTGRLAQLGVSVDTDQSIEAIINRPVAVSTLEKLYTRTFDELNDIPDDAATQISQTVSRGFGNGWHPRKMADEINDEVQDITKSRATTIARSETINAASEGTLDRFEQAGIDIVHHGEWEATDDDRTCPICQALDGREFQISEFRTGTFEFEPGPDEPDYLAGEYRLKPPAHPNGRCTILPVVE